MISKTKRPLYVISLLLIILFGCHNKEWQSTELMHVISENSRSYRCEEVFTYPELINEGYTTDEFSAKYVTRGRKCLEWGYVSRNGDDDFANFDGPNGGGPGPNGYLANNTGGGGGGDNNCLVGTWERLVCGSTTQKATVTFSGNGTAVFNDWDCTLQCPRVYEFSYAILNSSELQVTYTSARICTSTVTPPSGGTQAYSCNGNTLTFGNTYTRRPS